MSKRLLLCLALGTALTALADTAASTPTTTDPTTQQLQQLNTQVGTVVTTDTQIQTSTSTLVALVQQILQTLLATNGPSLTDTQTADSVSFQPIAPLTTALNLEEIQEAVASLLGNGNPPKSRILSLINQEPSVSTATPSVSVFGSNSGNTASTLGVSYNADLLVTPSVYSTPAITPAQMTQSQLASTLLNTPIGQFIELASGLARPLPIFNINTLSTSQQQSVQGTPLYTRYQILTRSTIAARSVGLDNLFHLALERQPQVGLGAKAGMPIADASEMQVRDFQASRRIQNPDWFTALQNASPAGLNREQLLLLAEIRKELHESRKDMERLIAAMSLLQVQFADQSRLTLEDIVRGLNAQLSGQKPQTMTNS